MAAGLLSQLFILLVVVLAIDDTTADSSRVILIPYNIVLIREADFYILPFLAHELEEFHKHLDANATLIHFEHEFNYYKYEMNNALRAWRNAEPDNPMAFESILHIVMNLEKVPKQFMNDLRFFGGGFVNHCFYFGILSPNEEGVERSPKGYLLDEINENFGSLDGLKKEVEEALKNVRGSGYIWVSRVPGKDGKGSLTITTTSNQDSPIMAGLHPIIVIDMWEHAYYLKHNYKRWEHLKDFWMVLDWDYVERLDTWWKNLDEEKRKADERVEALKKSILESEKREKRQEENKSEL